MKLIFTHSLLRGLIVLSVCGTSFAQKASTPATAASAPAKPAGRYYRCVDIKAADGAAVPSCEVAQIAQVRQDGKDVNVLTLAIAKTMANELQKPAVSQ